MTVQVIFLTTTGLNTWPVPQDWNSAANTIECLGPGGDGANSGYAGGGGAYSKISNLVLTPRGTAAYNVGTPGNDTWISNTGVAPTSTSEGVLAKAGQLGTVGNLGGAAASGIGTTKFSGGNGASVGGGGGAAGPGGNGGNGASVGTNGGGGGGAAGLTGAGGNASGSTGGVAGTGSGVAGANGTSGAGAAGNNGTLWTATAGGTTGPGSGGSSGGSSGGLGGPGGSYGGGGGAGGETTGGAGAPGIIVITYTPAVTSAAQGVCKTQINNQKLRGHPSRKRSFIHGAPTMLRWRHLTSYFQYTPTPYTPRGPGETDIRQKEPILVKLRSTLTKLRIISPTLEE